LLQLHQLHTFEAILKHISLIRIALLPIVIGCANEKQTGYNFTETDVSYFNINDGIELSGTLTIPTSKNPVPAVLLIQGSGPYDRDETIGSHKIFKVLAQHLAENGMQF
jgi:dipeptidyl aminopeptidase/acylaminoacyl peptidase